MRKNTTPISQPKKVGVFIYRNNCIRFGLKKCLHAFLINMTFFSINVYADSPITMTDFYKPYLALDIVSRAHEERFLSDITGKYLLDESKTIDVKAAIISALSWDERRGVSLYKYLDMLAEKYNSPYEDLKIIQLGGDELFCLAYLYMKEDYTHPAEHIGLFELAKKRLRNSFTFSAVYGLAKAQEAQARLVKIYKRRTVDKFKKMVEDPQYKEYPKREIWSEAHVRVLIDEATKESPQAKAINCLMWLSFEEEVETEGLLQDMNLKSKEIIYDYMNIYKDSCKGIGEFFKGCPDRG